MAGSPLHVLIAGGGIAGLTSAIALRQRGISSTVFESVDRGYERGAGLMLGANALEVLDRLQLFDAVRAQGHEARELGAWKINGEPLQLTTGEEWEKRYGRRTIVIHRNALHRVLSGALEADSVKYEKRVAGVVQNAERASLKFEDGSEAEGDVIVGADGLYSTVRQALFGPTKYRYAGETSWRGISDHVIASGPRAQSLAEIWGVQRGHRFGFGPISPRQTYFFATAYTPAGGRDESPEAALRSLRQSFADFVPEVSELLRHTSPERLIRTDIFDFKPRRRWHTGRVVLVGDAAHATTPNLGQGACQAIESAYVLAQELASRAVPDAFVRYERIRMQKAHYVTRMSWRFGKIVDMPGPIGRWLRYSVLPRAPKSSTFKQMDRIYRLNF